VASYRLHGTLDRKEVVDAIQEIIANLIGSEEACLFEAHAASGALELAACFGVTAESARAMPAACAPIAEAVKSGEIFVTEVQHRQGSALEDRLTACVPLKLDGRVTGAIAIFQLLPQKSAIEDVDRELFDLLATHAATALYCTSLHARRGALASR
jgi:GAF domain-containing protein